MKISLLTVALVTLASPCFGAISLRLTSSLTGPQPVGTPITFTATASDSDPGTLDYQFSGGVSGAALQLIQDYDISNQMTWAATSKEGNYAIQVIARNTSTKQTQTAVVPVTVTSRVTGTTPVISSTVNPLVALYSAPGCPSGSIMYVWFGVSSSSYTETGAIPCTPNESMNFYVAGMTPNTSYTMYYVVKNSAGSKAGPTSVFQTGTLDPGFAVPPYTISSKSGITFTQNVLLLDFTTLGFSTIDYFPTAINLKGQVIWYYPNLGVPSEVNSYFIRPVPQSGGHFLLILEDPNTLVSDQILREIDLAGNTVKETSVTRVSEQLVAQGKLGITDFDHDAVRLPNGHTIVIGSQEQIYPAGTQGSAGPIDILLIIV